MNSAMPILTIGELRKAGGDLQIECLRCGHVERRAVGLVEGPDALAIGAIGLRFTCRPCGAKACITTGVKAVPPPKP